jgi:DnaJ-class molecular chaperone
MAQQRTQSGGSDRRDDWQTAAGLLSGEDNYYQLLDVPVTASKREITKAYRAIMLKWHPDRVRPEQRDHAEDLAKRLNLAYATLTDPVRRKRYDQTIRTEQLQSDIMNRYVGGFAWGNPATAAEAPRREMTARERRERRDSDRRANISLLAFFLAVALFGIGLLVFFSLVNLAGSALF